MVKKMHEKNPFEKRRDQLLAEVEAAVNQPKPMSYDEKHAIRRKHRKKVTHYTDWVQTCRVRVTLECGHWDSFTLSAKAYKAGKWKTARRQCYECAKAEIESKGGNL